VGGAALGAEAGTTFPLVFGTLGTMLGGALTIGAWYLLSGVCYAARAATRHESGATQRSDRLAPAPGVS